MDTKAIVASTVSALVTAAALGIVGFFVGVFERGAEAMTEDQIEEVIKKVLVTDSGMTHAAALADINMSLSSMEATMETRFDGVEKSVDKLEEAMRELAR